MDFHSDGESAEPVAAKIRMLGQGALDVQVDAVDEALATALSEAADRVGAEMGVVSSAGVGTAVGRLEQDEPAAMHRGIAVHLVGVVICCKHARRSLTKAGGGLPGDHLPAVSSSPRRPAPASESNRANHKQQLLAAD